MKLQKQKIHRQTFILKDHVVNILGPELILENCTINSEASREALSMADVTITGGNFISSVELKDYQWCKVALKGVAFSGHFSGCDFGQWEEFHGAYGEIQNCDFSRANLEGCRFMNCDISTIKLPCWPYFTVKNPAQNALEINGTIWPGKLKLMMGIIARSPEGCSAVTHNAESLTKRLGGSVEEFRQALSRLDCVIM